MLNVNEWTPVGNLAEILDVSDAEGWQQLRDWYTAPNSPSPQLERIIEIASQHAVVSVLVERRYIDADWRSEHSRFFGGTFKRYPTVCHRLHFFSAVVDPTLDGLAEMQDAYRGYSVMRPLPWAPVGRTMLTPPPELSGATVSECVEQVTVFGARLTVTGMPFISQDSQYLRCAHAAIWMVMRHSHLKHGVPRQLTGEVREAAVGGLVVGRQLPSDGLSLSQMLNALDVLGLSAGSLTIGPKGRPDDKSIPGSLSLYAIACRQINSDLPPIVVSESHAWVLVAWARQPSGGHSRLTLWRHDDAVGPYIRIDDPYNETNSAHSPWVAIITPLLPKMNIDAERAEATGAAFLDYFRVEWGNDCARSTQLHSNNQLTYRTFAVKASDFKARLGSRRLDAELVRLYRSMQMPRYVWVVEAVDKEARSRLEPDVLGEVVLDSTYAAPQELKHAAALVVHLEGKAYAMDPDAYESLELDLASRENYLSDRDAR